MPPARGPVGNSSVCPVRLLSGGNRQHRQVNTPDQAIRTWHEGAGLASQLCPSGWPRDVGTRWVWIYSPSPNSAHQPDQEPGQEPLHLWSITWAGETRERQPRSRGTRRTCQAAPPKCTPAWHIPPHLDAAVAHSVSQSPQYPPPAWVGALLLGTARQTFPGLLGPGKTRQRSGGGVVPSHPALPRRLMWGLASAASPRRLHAVIPE